MPSLVRIAAAVVALIGWFGLAVQFNATLAASSFGGTVWILLRFFTIWTNIVVAVVMTGTAFGSPRFGSPRVLGFATLSILRSAWSIICCFAACSNSVAATCWRT